MMKSFLAAGNMHYKSKRTRNYYSNIKRTKNKCANNHHDGNKHNIIKQNKESALKQPHDDTDRYSDIVF